MINFFVQRQHGETHDPLTVFGKPVVGNQKVLFSDGVDSVGFTLFEDLRTNGPHYFWSPFDVDHPMMVIALFPHH